MVLYAFILLPMLSRPIFNFEFLNFFFFLIEIVKGLGDLNLKLTTQCVQSKNVVGKPGQGPDPCTMANICLKLNAKLGGINNLISKEVR